MEVHALERSVQKIGAFNPPMNEKLTDVNFMSYQLSADVIRRKSHAELDRGRRISQTINRLASDTKIHGLQLTTSKLRRNYLVADPVASASNTQLFFIDGARSICRVVVGSPADPSISVAKLVTLPILASSPKIDLPEDATLKVVANANEKRFFVASDGHGLFVLFDENCKPLLQEHLTLQHEGGSVAFTISAAAMTPDNDIHVILQYIEESVKIRSLPKGLHKVEFVHSGANSSVVESASELETKALSVTDAVNGVILQVLRLKRSGTAKYGIASRHYIYSSVTPTEIRWSADGSHFVVVSSKPFLQVPGDNPDNLHPEMIAAADRSAAVANTNSSPADASTSASFGVDPLAHMTTVRDEGPATQTVNRLGGDDEEFAQDETEEGVSVWYYSLVNGYPVATYQRTLGQYTWLCHQYANSSASKGSPPSALHFGLKYDVDCLVYELPLPLSGETPQDLSHVSTFNAFAYVLDSKRNRRLVSFSPARNYAVCAEINRFVYVYKKEKPGTHKSVCNIEEVPGDIAGIMPLDDRLVLLTDNQVSVCYIE